MPVYAYQCPDCGSRFELVRSMDDSTHPVCWWCEDVPLTKVPSAPNFTIKGYSAKNGYSK